MWTKPKTKTLALNTIEALQHDLEMILNALLLVNTRIKLVNLNNGKWRKREAVEADFGKFLTLVKFGIIKQNWASVEPLLALTTSV